MGRRPKFKVRPKRNGLVENLECSNLGHISEGEENEE